jgi:hypothetical protein
MTGPAGDSRAVTVPQSRTFDVLGMNLDGDVAVPEDPTAVVLFLRGLNEHRDDKRDLRVANLLNDARIATVRVDLLTAAEQRIDAATAELRFNADLLGVRTIALIDLIAAEHPIARLPGGLFGSHSACAAALIAAAARPRWVRAIAAASGRPDLAGEFLLIAHAPTLLAVGEYDTKLREINEDAADRIAGPARVAVIPDVGHQFDDPSAQTLVAQLCGDLFRELLRVKAAQRVR